MLDRWTSLPELLEARAATAPAIGYTYIDGEREQLLSYAALDARARRIAGLVRDCGGAGERALLLFPPGLDYVASFFGCLYARAIAVPAYPPDPSRLERTLPRLTAIVADARPALVLTTAAIAALATTLTGLDPRLAGLRWVAVDDVAAATATPWRDPDLSRDTVAFLQYTSGSTGDPKGVVLAHGHLLANQIQIRAAFGTSESSSVVGWLPLYHDMGLIGNLLHPLYLGGPCALMSPLAFMQQPLRWLRAITRFRATTSGGPDFAYDLCARKARPEDLAELELSSWTVAFDGAEPVRAETLRRFALVFAECGFRRAAFHPCYGLAEATLIVAGGPVDTAEIAFDAHALAHGRAERAAGGRPLVASGAPLGDETVAIVDPDTRTELPEGRVGAIWTRGPSVAAGYWGRPELTERVFGARLADGRGPFLDTGDLGFVLDGALYITGRVKDLLILRGRNVYPQDLERGAEQACARLRPGCAAAFAETGEHGEQAVIVAEVDTRFTAVDGPEVAHAVRHAIAAQHEVAIAKLVLIRAGSLPKTSSGKVQRRATREALVANQLPVVWSSELAAPALAEHEPAASDVPGRIRAAVARLARIPAWQVSDDIALTAHGLDSLGAAELAAWLDAELGLALDATELLRGPTVAELAARAATPTRAAGSAIARRPAGAPARLSHAQQRLWILDRLLPGRAVYAIPGLVETDAALDVPTLEHALSALVERHESLRTAFALVDGEPRQRVFAAAPIAVAVTECEGADFAERERDARRRAQLIAARPFALERGPLVRAELLAIAPARQLLVLVLHHIVADGWSMGVLIDELAELYAARLAGRAARLAPLPIQYADYAEWQRTTDTDAALATSLDYWRRALAGAPVLDLPTDRPRPAAPSYRAGHRRRRLAAALAHEVGERARRAGVTRYTVLLAAWTALMARYAGQRDVTIGTAVAGRRRAELRGLIGFFVNPLALRTRWDGDPSFDALLARVAATALEAFEHDRVPFDRVVEAVQPAREANTSPLFQVIFAHERFAPQLPRLGAARLARVELDEGFDQYDLTLIASEDAAGGIALDLQYAHDLFDATSADRMLDHYERLLGAVLADPARPIGDAVLVDAREVEALAGRGASPRPEACLHLLVEAQAERAPGAIAIEHAGGCVSYRELTERVDALARRLRARGVATGDVVGVAVARSPEWIIALLAVMRAGGVYLPLDERAPVAAVRHVLDDARPVLVIADRARAAKLPEPTPALVLGDADAIAAPAFAPAADPRAVAYVIYTSGSTGQPKGVAIEHRAAAAYARELAERQRVGPGDRVLQFCALSFDTSLEEIFLALGSGATLVLRDEAMLDADALIAAVAARRITVLDLPTAYWHELTGALAGRALDPCLRLVIIGGEAARPDALARWHAGVGTPVALLNTYGPTETTIVATIAELGRTDAARRIPIGRPVAHARAYVLGPSGELQPPGAAGELHIGGGCLARGYLGKPALTAERFVPDPFSPEPGARMYRTGDRARWLADGTLTYLGRIDHQVKIRGYRVEPGAVEAALTALPGVRDAAVIARPDASGHARLVAYIAGDPAGVREALAAKLPDYMVPADLIALAALPRLPSGKLDRAALPAPERPTAVEVATDERAPLEARLLELWRELLDLTVVGLDDDFFELGGHSLLAVQLAVQLGNDNLEVSVGEIFEHPTVRELAALLAPRRAAPAPEPEPTLTRIDRDARRRKL